MTQEKALSVTPLGSVSMIDPEQLIAKALEHGVQVDVLERLLSMRQDLVRERARNAYFSALSKFQSECPVIQKRKEVKNKDGSVRYAYAPLDDIVAQAGPHLKNNGFSWSYRTENIQDGITVVCDTHHEMGHGESSPVTIPIEKEAFMNDAQKSASAITFASRYAFRNAFGILTGDTDDDGNAMGGGIAVTDLYKRFAATMRAAYDHHESIMTIREACETGYYDPGAAAWFELPDEAKSLLWVAPTKGGPFTTEEREIMKTEKWRKAYYKDEVTEKK